MRALDEESISTVIPRMTADRVMYNYGRVETPHTNMMKTAADEFRRKRCDVSAG